MRLRQRAHGPRLLAVAAGLALVGGAPVAAAPPPSPSPTPVYPARGIEIIAPSGPGRGWETLARAVARTLDDERLVPVPVAVVDMPGGSGAVVFAHMVTRRSGDAHVLAVMGSALTGTLARRVVPYSYRDVTPVATLVGDYFLLAVRRDSAFDSLRTFLKVMRRDPGLVTIGGGAPPGSQPHLAVARLARSQGIDPMRVRYVPFPDTAAAVASVLGGTTTVLSASLSEVRPILETGHLRVLAVLAPQKAGPRLPGIPSAQEQGVDFIFATWRGLYMPPEVPPASARFWETALKRLARSRGWSRTLEEHRWTPFLLTGPRLRAFLDDDVLESQRVLQELGLVR